MTASAAIQGYRSFLACRDGEPDREREVLPRREAFFRAVEERPVRSRRVFDRAVFLRNAGTGGSHEAARIGGDIMKTVINERGPR